MTVYSQIIWAISFMVACIIAASRKHWNWASAFLIVDFLLVVVLVGRVL